MKITRKYICYIVRSDPSLTHKFVHFQLGTIWKAVVLDFSFRDVFFNGVTRIG